MARHGGSFWGRPVGVASDEGDELEPRAYSGFVEDRTMRRFAILAACAATGIFTWAHAEAQSDDEWVAVTDPQEVWQLVSDRTLDGKSWRHFYRSDGNMAYYNVDTDAMSVRKWTVKDDGRFCVAVYEKPKSVIDCFTILEAEGSAGNYQLSWASGTDAFELIDGAPENMAQAIDEVAGPAQ